MKPINILCRGIGNERPQPGPFIPLALAWVVAWAAGALAARASHYPPPAPGELWLTVSETAGVARTQEMVRSGIPVPRNLKLVDPGALTLVSSNGQPIAAEFQALARWNAGLTNGSAPLQWLLVTFPASVPANGSAAYRVVTDGSAGPNPAPTQALRLVQQGHRVTVDTGAATFVLDGDTGALFQGIGLPGGTPLVSGGAVSARAVTYTPLAATNAVNYAAARRVVIEHQGPLVAVVVVEGVYDLPAVGGGGVATRLRYMFRAGSPTALVRQAVAWEGASCGIGSALSCNDGTNTFPDGIRVQRIEDALALELGPSLAVTAVGARGAPPVQGQISPGQTAWVRQQLRASRTNALAFEVQVAGQTAAGEQATGGLLAVSGAAGCVAVGLDHLHRYEPQALRVLADGRLAIDIADDQVWLGARQGLFARLAVGAFSNSPAADDLASRLWAPLNHPLRAWPSPAWFAASQAVEEFPVGALPGNLALYDQLLPAVLSNTLAQVEAKGLSGLQTFGLYPRYWADPTLADELGDDNPGNPTPTEPWDDLYWGATWTDYHNATLNAAIWAMRSGQVQWLDEISEPAALRMLHTQILQGAPDDLYFYIGQAPAGYGGYRDDFNGSHAYFDNLMLYYWLSGDYTVVETLQRGASSMRDYLCAHRPGSPCAPADPPTDAWAGLTGRVASQWNAVFRFVGLAGDDPTFLDDFKANLARAVSQYYVEAQDHGLAYGFWLDDVVSGPGTNTTGQLWMVSLYDMNMLYRLSLDTQDAPLGDPPLLPSRVFTAWARTLARFGPTVVTVPPFDAPADSTFDGNWPNVLDFVWSGNRLAANLSSVTGHYDPNYADNDLYDSTKATLCAVLARAADLTGDPALVQLTAAAAVHSLAVAWNGGAPLPLSKTSAEYLARLHPAVARIEAPLELRLAFSLWRNSGVLSWSAVPTNVVLEATDRLTKPSQWSPLPVPPYTAHWVFDPSRTNHQFFRLRLAGP